MKSVSREDRLKFLKKVKSGVVITNQDIRKVEPFNITTLPVWHTEYGDEDNNIISRYDTGESMTLKEWNLLHPDKSKIIVFE